MGGGSSARYVDGSNAFIISIMMPVYYIHDAEVTSEDIAEAAASWKLITDDTSKEFKRKKLNPSFTYFSCISWFFSLFYARLFDVHPLCKPLFSAGLQSQGKFLVKMISLTLSQLGNPEVFSKTMHELTIRHCERGVKAIEYGVVGDVLFWVIKTCIGESFTPKVGLAWTKIYSKMLQVIVPEAVAFERQGLHVSKFHRTSYVTSSEKEASVTLNVNSTSGNSTTTTTA
jgi:hemoglobin-like flavoprotein